MSTADRLVHMINQIALNLATQGEDAAAVATADHIAAFWDPRMKERILALRVSGGNGLSPVAVKAVDQLRNLGAPPPQTGATQFNHAGEPDRSDAG